MNARFSLRAGRLGVIGFTAVAVTALGCSLIVDFDETAIPADDAGLADLGTETAIDTGTLPVDTGSDDTGAADTGADDTGAADTGGDDTGSGDTGSVDTGAADTGADPDTGTVDSGDPDTGMLDTGTPDTTPLDTGADTTPETSDATATDGDTSVGDGDTAPLETFSSSLQGSQENPPVSTAAMGTATCTVTSATSVTCEITHSVASASGAHIHRGAPGINGPIVVPLATTATQTKVITAADLGETDSFDGFLADLRAGRLYVNVHSPTHAAGEVRGQLLATGEHLYSARVAAVSGVTSSGTGRVGFIRHADGTVSVSGEVTSLNAAPTAANLREASDDSAVTGGTLMFTAGTNSATFSGSLGAAVLTLAKLEGSGYYVLIATDGTSGGVATGEVRGTIEKHF